MNILLTNDDGISAPGLSSLCTALSDSFQVYTIAPDREMSACSSAISVFSPVKLKIKSDVKYSLEGYPADCVNVGINGNFIPKIDLVVSGINHGPNVGNDVYFSGTVAAARVAYIFGITGIAVSLDCKLTSDYFNDAADFVLNFIKEKKEKLLSKLHLFSINYPDLSKDEIRGVKYTKLGRREYIDTYNVIDEGADWKSVQMNGRIEPVELEGSDVTELRKGYISITPLSLDCTDYSFLDDYNRTEEQWPK